MKMGVIGFGVQGGFYVRMVHELNKLEGLDVGCICDINPGRRALAKEKYPEIPVFESGADLIESGLCDFVVVAVPHYSHPAIVTQALKRNMPVLNEKPSGVSAYHVRRMNACADLHADVPFGIMLNQRVNPAYIKLRELARSGEMGKLRSVLWLARQFRTQSYYDSGSWRASWGGEGGGVLVNQAPHQIDLLQWIFGMPQRVYAVCREGFRRNVAVETDVCAQFDYANGATGTFITCTHDILGEDGVTAVFDRGRVRIKNASHMTIEALCDTEDKLGTVYPESELNRLRLENKLVTQTVAEYEPVSEHMLVLRAFADCVKKGTPLVADGRDGLQGVILANAMQLSSWRRKPIDLPMDEVEYVNALNERIRAEGLYPQLSLE